MPGCPFALHQDFDDGGDAHEPVLAERGSFKCRYCNGTGKSGGSDCVTCGGSGREPERRQAA